MPSAWPEIVTIVQVRNFTQCICLFLQSNASGHYTKLMFIGEVDLLENQELAQFCITAGTVPLVRLTHHLPFKFGVKLKSSFWFVHFVGAVYIYVYNSGKKKQQNPISHNSFNKRYESTCK